VYDDLSYFFQLALYDGEGARYEFNIERFCQVFKHFPTRLSGALSVLQRAGYIEYDADPDNHPRCQFLLPRDGLYQLRGLSANEDTVMTALLRIYCGLFSDLVYIEEARIADYSHLSVDIVRVVLKSLASRHILKYIPRRNVPVIYYPQQRIESSRLVFPRAIYEELQERMAARVDSVLEYAESDDECRSTVLLRYLGEKTETDCGYCDVCVEKKRKGSSISTSHEDAVQVIVDAINDAGGSLPIAQIHSLPLTKHQLDVALEQLRSEDRLVIKGSKVALVK
jgi:ATP-dependent DNA helicase RecQ